MNSHSTTTTVALLAAALALATPEPLAAQASKGVHVCLGTDNALRHTTADRCPQGQRMFRLAEVEDEVGVAKERDDPPSAVLAELKTRIDFLTRRMSSLERERGESSTAALTELRGKLEAVTRRLASLEQQGGARSAGASRVRAPFEVVDAAGNPILVVTDQAFASASRRGRVHVGTGSIGNYGIWVRTAEGQNVATVGEGKTGQGAVAVYDDDGKERVALIAAHGITITNLSDKEVVNLTWGPQGGGILQLFDGGGRTTVEAGTTDGKGVVRVGPMLTCTPGGPLRVPDCIRGRSQP